MNARMARALIAYGAFLMLMGLAGYLSNPEKAKTALMSGGIFGTLSILWGWMMARGFAWSGWSACATTAFLVVVFSWRASVSWMAFANGAADKLTAAVLITAMGAASILMLVALVRGLARRQPHPGEPLR